MTVDGPRERWTWREYLLAAPLLAVAFAGAGMAVAGLIQRLLAPCPANPWEAGLAVEVYRLTHRMPVYTPPALDHSTNMYGPLHVVWLALGAEVLGRHLWSLRAVPIGAASALAFLGAWLVGNRLPVLVRIACAGVLLSLGFPCYCYFADPRPDAMALLLAFGAVTLLFAGEPRERPGQRRAWALGLVLMVAAMLTKQTAAMFSAVPLVALFMDRPTSWRRGIAWAASPLVAVIAAIGAVRLFLPNVSHYMLEVPALPCFRVQLRDIWPMALVLVGLMPLGFVGLFATCCGDGAGASEPDRRSRWLLAAFAVAVPMSILTAAHGGGASNSLLPGLVAGYLLAIHALNRSVDFWRWRTPVPTRQVGVSIGAALLLAAFFFSNFRVNWMWCTSNRFGDRTYEQVVETVAKLPGRVLSPSDPSITLRALGRPGVGRCLIFEVDASGWHGYPDYVNAYLRSADWIVGIHTNWGDMCTGQTLTSLGFEEVTDWPQRTAVYSLWRRVR